MASTQDPRNDRGRYKNERRRVREAIEKGLITDADGEELLAFGDNLRGRHEPSTSSTQLGGVRRAAIMATAAGFPPLVEWDEQALDRFMVRMEDDDLPDEELERGGGPWREGTRRNYKQCLKNFLGYLGREWAEDIYIGAPAKGSVERDDLLTQDELTALWEVADHPRDECLLALPLVTWNRNAALRALRVRDVEIADGDQTGFIRLNDSALGQKDATGKRPLTWGTGPVERLLSKHPRRHDDDFEDAPLLYVITDAGGAEKGSMLSNNEAYNRRLRTLARRAGLERDRWESSYGRRERTIRAHILRYTGATRAALSDEYKEATIKKWGGWNMSSKQLDRYLQLFDDDVLAAADDAHGIDSSLPQRPEFGQCPKCGAAIEEWHRACPTCTFLLSDEMWGLREAAEGVHEESTERAVTSKDDDLVRALQAARRATDDPDEFAEVVAAAISDVSG